MEVSVINMLVVCQIWWLCLLGLQATPEVGKQIVKRGFSLGFGKRTYSRPDRSRTFSVGYKLMSNPNNWKYEDKPSPFKGYFPYYGQGFDFEPRTASYPNTHAQEYDYQDMLQASNLDYDLSSNLFDTITDTKDQNYPDNKGNKQLLKKLIQANIQRESNSYPSTQQQASPFDVENIVSLHNDDNTYRRSSEQELELQQLLQDLLSDN